MFKFDLPVGTILVAQLPAGNSQRLVHMGDGRFVSDIPPIVFEGIRIGAAHDPAPASWDETAAVAVLNAADELKGFDVEATAASVRYFAEQGQPRAKAIMDKLKVAEVMVKSRDAIMDKQPQRIIVVGDGNVTGAISASLAQAGHVKLAAGD